MQTNWLDNLLSEDTIEPVRNGSYGNKLMLVFRDSGTYQIKDFGGISSGVKPTASTLSEVDFLKFIGEDLTPDKMLLNQQGKDLVIDFEGIEDVQVVLQKFNLQDLDNLTKATKGSLNIGNILFEGDNYFKDSFDVFDTDRIAAKVYRPKAVTFLNDLNNNTSGYDNSNDVINGQGGNDTLMGLSGSDILRGGDGSDVLTGGKNTDIFCIASNILPTGVDTITDFQVGMDVIKIAGIDDANDFQDLTVLQTGNDTTIKLGNLDLAVLKGIQANTVTSDSFAFI
jgi:Ca2+-binding RTX toxin-like protein